MSENYIGWTCIMDKKYSGWKIWWVNDIVGEKLLWLKDMLVDCGWTSKWIKVKYAMLGHIYAIVIGW